MQSWHFSHINRITEKKRLRNTSFLNDHFAGTCTISHLSQWWTRVKVVSLFVLLLRCPNSRIRLSGAVGQYWFTGVTFPVRCTLMVLCFITRGKNKGLLFRTWPEKIIIIIIILETFYWQKTVCALRTVYEEERTHSSCCPWFLNQVRGCMDRTRSCFCVSSSTQYPPDLYSVCGSLSHSLEDRENVKLLKHYHFKDSFTQIKKTFCGLSRVIRPLFLEQHSLFQCWRVIL